MPDPCPVMVVALAEDRSRLDCITYFLSGKNKTFFPFKNKSVMCWGCHLCVLVLHLCEGY